MQCKEENAYDTFCASAFIDDLRRFTTTWFGERCLDYEAECACCKAWNLFDQYKSHTLD